MNLTRKLPSKATMRMTITISHIPTQIRPTMYSMFWDLQNYRWMNEGKEALMRKRRTGEESFQVTHAEERFLKQQQGSREADHKDGLGSEEAEDDPLDAGGDHQLRYAHHSFRFVG